MMEKYSIKTSIKAIKIKTITFFFSGGIVLTKSAGGG